MAAIISTLGGCSASARTSAGSSGTGMP